MSALAVRHMGTITVCGVLAPLCFSVSFPHSVSFVYVRPSFCLYNPTQGGTDSPTKHLTICLVMHFKKVRNSSNLLDSCSPTIPAFVDERDHFLVPFIRFHHIKYRFSFIE